MRLRHAPFGIPKLELQQALARRRRADRRALSTRTAALTRLQATAAELNQYSALLGAEITALEAAERDLLRELAPFVPEDAAPPPDPITELRQSLAYYRTLQTEISAGVLSLIAPFLKEGTAWRSTLRSG